jgi:hypothetical protein
MLREVAILAGLEEGSRFHKFSRRTFPLATLWDRDATPYKATATPTES